MGYYTEYYGELHFNKPVSKPLSDYLSAFFSTDHNQRDVSLITEFLQKRNIPLSVILPPSLSEIGTDGKFFVDRNNSPIHNADNQFIIDSKTPADDCPSTWCNFSYYDEENCLMPGDGYNTAATCAAWLKWLITYLFQPEDLILNGIISYEGENSDDKGFIHVSNNRVHLFSNNILNGINLPETDIQLMTKPATNLQTSKTLSDHLSKMAATLSGDTSVPSAENLADILLSVGILMQTYHIPASDIQAEIETKIEQHTSKI